MTTVEIAPLTVETWAALAELFAAGGDPKWCWCNCPVGAQRVAGPVVTWRGVEDPELILGELIEGYFTDSKSSRRNSPQREPYVRASRCLPFPRAMTVGSSTG